MKNYLIPHARIPVNPYYPADLLSSSLPRVLHAVQTLHAERSRGLRVFHAGKLTSSDSHLTALNVAAHAIIRNNNCSRAILQVQAYDTIDNTGAETIMKHLVDLVGHEQATSLIQQRLRRPFECSDHALEALESSLSYDMPELARQQHCTKIYEEAMQTVKTMSVTQSVAILSRFLQAAVAKDCSMLIALCRKNEVEREDGEVVCVGGVEWMFRIWVVDVGEKSLGKLLHKWGVEDRERATVLANRNLGGSEFSTWKDQATP